MGFRLVPPFLLVKCGQWSKAVNQIVVKGQYMVVTVKYGFDQASATLWPGARFQDLKNDQNVRAALGYGDNVRMLMNGVEMPLDAVVPAGAVVSIETAANTKAVFA